MRNRWGVEIKKGHWVFGRSSRGDVIEGRVSKIERTGEFARAYGPRVILEGGTSIGIDDVSQTLGPMTVEDDGTVRQNPGYKLPRGRDRWYIFGTDGALIAGDLFYKTALGALRKVFPGVHVYSSGVSGAGTVSYAIDKEPRHVFVSPDPDFDLRRKAARENPAPTLEGVTIELIDYKGREFTDGIFSVRKDSIDPGWFVWGRWAGASANVVKRVAWPEGSRVKWPKISRLVQPGFRTKAEAQAVADRLNAVYQTLHIGAEAKLWARGNPLTRVRIKSPPQRPAGNDDAPSPRLVKRRKKTAKAAPGVYANPAPSYLYCVWRLDANGHPAYFMRAERSLKLAKEYASALADKAGTPYGIIKKPI